MLKIDISPYLSEKSSVHSSRFWTGWMSHDQKWKCWIGQTPSSTEPISCSNENVALDRLRARQNLFLVPIKMLHWKDSELDRTYFLFQWKCCIGQTPSSTEPISCSNNNVALDRLWARQNLFLVPMKMLHWKDSELDRTYFLFQWKCCTGKTLSSTEPISCSNENVKMTSETVQDLSRWHTHPQTYATKNFFAMLLLCRWQ